METGHIFSYPLLMFEIQLLFTVTGSLSSRLLQLFPILPKLTFLFHREFGLSEPKSRKTTVS